jgi:hypothetical protein
MTPISVMTTHALVAIGYAIPLLFAPDDFLWLYGAQADPDASHLARLLGTSLVAVSAITWLAREAPEGEALDAICFGLAIGGGLATLVSLVHQLTAPTAGLLGWTTVLACGGLSAAHALLWLGRATRRAAAPTMSSAG